MTPRTTDVAVVGASIAGLATALGLARSGVDVTVLDTLRAPRLPWTAVHHWSVLPVLEGLGVLDDALVAGEATAHWGLHVLATGERHVYDVRELGPEVRLPFNLRLEPNILRGILRTALLACPNGEIVEDVHLEILRQHDGVVDLLLDGGAAGPRTVRALGRGRGRPGQCRTTPCRSRVRGHDVDRTLRGRPGAPRLRRRGLPRHHLPD